MISLLIPVHTFFGSSSDKPAVCLGDSIGRSVTIGIDVVKEPAIQHVGAVGARYPDQSRIEEQLRHVELGSFLVNQFEHPLFDIQEGNLRPLTSWIRWKTQTRFDSQATGEIGSWWFQSHKRGLNPHGGGQEEGDERQNESKRSHVPFILRSVPEFLSRSGHLISTRGPK